MPNRFEVDLGGMVDLLSHHLYSGPQVFLRELLQNAVDAITARQELDPSAPGTIRLSCSQTQAGVGQLEITDSGIGLTAADAEDLLATIGRSSKRDPLLGLGRSEFIGQFGIGMLSAFMVADRIEVESLSAQPGARPIRWIGWSNGTFEIEDGPQMDVGSRVRLTARDDAAHWLDTTTVVGLATDYGSLLPFDVAVEVPVEGVGLRWRRITVPMPWQAEYPHDQARAKALATYCEQVFGFTPLGHIDLNVPLTGVSGVAFILPQAVAPGSGLHRVYTKRMLLGQRVGGLLPDWAFFTRAVLNSDVLSPTASREQLREDEILLATRDALGEQLKTWATTTLSAGSPLARAFIDTHHLALRALAQTDNEILDLAANILPFETTDGIQTLADVAKGGDVVFTPTTEAFRRIATVARSHGLVVVNAGYVYDSTLMDRLARRPGWRVRELTAHDLDEVLRVPDAARETQIADAVVAARELLTREDCDVLVRVFSPEGVPAILLRDPDNEHRRDLNRERDAAPGLWGGLLDQFASETTARTRTLVLNDSSPVVRRLLAAGGGDVFAAGVRSLYFSAVMLAGDGLLTNEVVALNDVLGTLLDASLDSRG